MGRNLEKALQNMAQVESVPRLRSEVQQFLGCFPNAKIKMGEALLIHRDADGVIFIVRPVRLGFPSILTVAKRIMNP